jgi:Insect cuticle protein
MLKSAIFLALAATALAYDAPAPNYGEPAAYAYNYNVHDGYSGAYFNAGEHRNGYATSGSYSVALPDGRVQTVNYRVADATSGYVADVHYSGVPHYNSYVHNSYPAYSYYKNVHGYSPAYASGYIAYIG